MHSDPEDGCVRERDTGSASSCSAAIQPRYTSLSVITPLTQLLSRGVPFRETRGGNGCFLPVFRRTNRLLFSRCSEILSHNCARGNNATRSRIASLRLSVALGLDDMIAGPKGPERYNRYRSRRGETAASYLSSNVASSKQDETSRCDCPSDRVTYSQLKMHSPHCGCIVGTSKRWNSFGSNFLSNKEPRESNVSNLKLALSRAFESSYFSSHTEKKKRNYCRMFKLSRRLTPKHDDVRNCVNITIAIAEDVIS